MTSPSTIKQLVSVIINEVPRLQAAVFGNEWPPHPHSAHTLLDADDHLQYMLCTAGVDRPFVGDVYVDTGYDIRGVTELRFDDAYRLAYTTHQPTEWTQDHIKLAASEAEWEAAYDRFGMVSLLAMVSAAYDSGGVETIATDGGLTVDGDVIFYPGSNMIITRTEAGDGFRFDALTGEISYPPSSYSVVAGTYVSGNLASITTPDDSDVLEVDEVATAPGFSITIDVDDVENFDRIETRVWYDAPAPTAHTVAFQVWRTDTSAWETQGTFGISETYQVLLYQFPSDTNYINSGTVKVRFYHSASGNVTHDLKIDYIAALRNVASGAVITDHGALSGLGDDDHSIYLLVSGAREADRLGFNSLGAARAVRQIAWNEEQGCLEYGMLGSHVTNQLGKEIVEYGKNTSGVAITNGMAVQVTGNTGRLPNWAASTEISGDISATFGVATEDIADNAWGYATSVGNVGDMDTSMWSVGDILWKGDAGALTDTQPDAPNESVVMGVVMESHATQGSMYVRVKNIPRLNHLSDVNVRDTVPFDGNAIAWDATNARWDLTDYITSPYESVSFSAGLAAGYDWGTYKEVGFWMLDDTYYTYLSSNSGSDGTIALGAEEGTDYANLVIDPYSVSFTDLGFHSSGVWTSDRVYLSGNITEVAKLYHLGPAVDPSDGTGVADTEKSIVASILAAAYLPENAIAYGDANNLQYGDVSKLAFDRVLFDGAAPLNYNLLYMGDAGIGSFDGTLYSEAGDHLAFRDAFVGASGYFADGMVFAWDGELSEIVTEFGDDVSLLGVILDVFKSISGGGSLQDAYDFGGDGLGGVMDINGQAVTIKKSVGSASSILFKLENLKTADAAPLMLLDNDCAWDPGIAEPYAIYLDGAAGNVDETTGDHNLGHRIWTPSDSVAMGRSITDSGFESDAYVRAARSYTNPATYENWVELAVRQNTDWDYRSFVRVFMNYSNTVPDTPQSSAIEMYGVTGAVLRSAGDVDIYSVNNRTNIYSSGTGDVLIQNANRVEFEESLMYSSSGVVAINGATSDTFRHMELGENVTIAWTNDPTGSTDITLLFRNTDSSGHTVGAFTKSSAAFVTWMGLNPNTSAVLVDAGYVLTVLLRYHATAGVYTGYCTVSVIAEV